MGDLEHILPTEITNRDPLGTELVIPVEEAKWAVRIASQNSIAVLGVEAFRILRGGFGVETYTGYGFNFEKHWPSFVRLNNEAASCFLDETGLGDGYGYILTATSEDEFSELRAKI